MRSGIVGRRVLTSTLDCRAIALIFSTTLGRALIWIQGIPCRKAARALPGASPQSRTPVIVSSGNSPWTISMMLPNQAGPRDPAALLALQSSRVIEEWLSTAIAAWHAARACSIPCMTARSIVGRGFVDLVFVAIALVCHE